MDNEKIVIAPMVMPERQLQNLQLHSFKEMEVGEFGTYQPAVNSDYQGDFDLIITPGLAFDSSKNRLGYGGGYYDRFLCKFPDALKIGIHYPFQLFDKIPIELHDIQLSRLLTIS